MPSSDVERSEAFYGGLGFRTAYKDTASYLIVARDEAELHFFLQPSHRPETCDHGAYLRPDDVDAFSDEVLRLGLPADGAFPKFRPAEDKPWGMREAALWDPDGNLIRAGTEIGRGAPRG